MWVLASAFDQDLAWIRRGQTARIEVSSLPGRKITGTVEAIEPSLDPVSRTATVRLLADNPVGAAMRLEMYATVRVEAEMGERLVVPRDAVLDTGERKIVFVVRGDGLEPREIETGIRADDGLEVTRGLKAGETVVLSGNFLIDAESRIRADIAKMMSAPSNIFCISSYCCSRSTQKRMILAGCPSGYVLAIARRVGAWPMVSMSTISTLSPRPHRLSLIISITVVFPHPGNPSTATVSATWITSFRIVMV